MAGEGLAALGGAASEFAKGFLQARLTNAQQAMQQHQQKIEDINTLSSSIDRFRDAPELQASLLSHLNEMVASLPKPPKAASDQHGSGVVDFFKNMFGGKKKTTPDVGPTPPGGTTPPADTLEPRLESPALQPASTGSQTFGDLSQMFGREVSAPSPAGTPASTASTPATPAAPTGLGSMAQQAPAPAQPAANEFLPRPDQLTQEAINKTMVKIPGVQVGGVRNPQLESRYVQQMAGAHADTALQSVEKVLAASPDIKTIGQAYNKLGPEFAHVMDAVQEYENAGMIPKGRLESWQKRFDDVRFGAEKYDSRAVKDGFQHNPVTDKYDIPVSDEAKLTAAYSTPSDKRTPDQLNRIAGHIEALDQKAKKDPSSLTADERSRTDFYNSLKAKGLVGQPLEDAYQAHAHPPAPLFGSTTGLDDNGRPVIVSRDERTGAMRVTPIAAPGSPFLASRYQVKGGVAGPPIKGPTGKDIPGPPVEAYSASRLIGAHGTDPAVTLPKLQEILQSGAAIDDRKKLSDYVNSKLPIPDLNPTQ